MCPDGVRTSGVCFSAEVSPDRPNKNMERAGCRILSEPEQVL